jgi:hypothetical protein
MYTKQNTSQDEIQTVRRTLINTRRVLDQGQHTYIKGSGLQAAYTIFVKLEFQR